MYMYSKSVNTEYPCESMKVVSCILKGFAIA